MSYTLEVKVKVREGDGEKLLSAIERFNKEAVEETGDDTYEGVYDVSCPSPNEFVLHGDPYDLGGFMIRLFTQNVWGGAVLINGGTLPVWDGTYEPSREADAEMEENLD